MPALTSELIALGVSTAKAIQARGSSKAQTRALKRAINVSNIFFGVVPDKNGGHTVLIKGRELLQEIAAGKQARTVAQGAIVVTCDEEAIAMRLTFGDGEDSAPALH